MLVEGACLKVFSSKSDDHYATVGLGEVGIITTRNKKALMR